MAKYELTFEQRILRFQFSGMSGVIGAGTRIEIYEQLELLLSNQVLLSKALAELYRVESKDGKRKKDVRAVVLYECMTAISSGRKLADALAPWVPEEESQLIRAGERSGSLAETFKNVVHVIDSKRTIVGSVIGAAIYPLFLSAMIVVLLHQIATNMVPQFSRVLPPDRWEGPALALRFIATMVTEYGIACMVALGILAAWVAWSLPNMSQSRWRNVLDKIPPWSIYRMLHGSTFLLNIAVMLQAGIRVQEVLTTMSKSGSPWLRTRIQGALMGINQGKNIGVALYEAGHHFPDQRAVQFLRILADQDGFDQKLANFAERWLQRSVKGIKAAASLMLLGGILTAGLLILLILAGVMSIQQLAQQGNL